MGGFPFGGGYFGLYAAAVTVVVPSQRAAVVGHYPGPLLPKPPRRPRIDQLEGECDLVLPLFAYSAVGEVQDVVPGTTTLEFGPIAYAADSVLIEPILGDMVMALLSVEARSHGVALDVAGVQEQRLLQAFRALSTNQQAEILKLVSGRTLKRH